MSLDVNSVKKLLDEIDWLAYLDAPLPSPVDARIEKYVAAFAQLTESQRAELRENTDPSTYQLLVAFAGRAASRAVREQSMHHLRAACRAVAAAGNTRNSDYRDTGVAILPLVDAARRIGADVASECAEAARLAHPQTASLFLAAGRRGTIRRLLDSAFPKWSLGPWSIEGSGNEFRYVVPGQWDALEHIASIRAKVEKG